MEGRTFSFIARSATDADRAAIFTLRGDRLSIGPGATVDYIERRLRRGQAGRALPWLKPAFARVVQNLEPFHVADVSASARGEALTVRAWVRGAGLRLTPITLHWSDVDNPEAAQGFVRELTRRQAEYGRRPGLPGPLGYWGFWAAVGAMTGVLAKLISWPAEGDGE